MNKKMKKSKLRRVKAFVAISPTCEGSNIYMPHGNFAIYENPGQARDCGCTEDDIVSCIITYRERQE